MSNPMWYEELLSPLTSKVFYKRRKAAQHFIERLFLFLETLFRPLPIELPLGIIEKMYAKYSLRRNNSVHIATFTRDLLGFSILYLKITNDFAIKNSIFIAFIDQKEEFRSLNFARDKRFAKKTLQGMINLVERITLKKFTVIDQSNPLHHNSLEVDLAHILAIVTLKKSIPLLDSMLHYFQLVAQVYSPYIQEGDKFGHFVIELYRLKNQLETQSIEEGLCEADPVNSQSFFAFGNPLESLPSLPHPSAAPIITQGFNPLFYSVPSTLEKEATALSTSTHFSFFTLHISQRKPPQEALVEDSRLVAISPPPSYSSLFTLSTAIPHCSEKGAVTKSLDDDEIDNGKIKSATFEIK